MGEGTVLGGGSGENDGEDDEGVAGDGGISEGCAIGCDVRGGAQEAVGGPPGGCGVEGVKSGEG